MGALRIALLVAAAAVLCVVAFLALTPPEGELPADSDLPREQSVDGWSGAADLAGTNTFEPAILPEGAGAPELTVRGIPGDSSRPVTAEYGGGLVIRQAHVDVDPQLEDEAAEVEGSDDAWWGTVQENTYLYVRKGETLVILSGASEEELIQTASSLEAVEVGDG